MYAELTVTCLEEDSFLIVTGGGSELHDLRRLREVTSRISTYLSTYLHIYLYLCLYIYFTSHFGTLSSESTLRH